WGLRLRSSRNTPTGVGRSGIGPTLSTGLDECQAALGGPRLLYGERGSCAAPLAAEKRTEVVAWRKAASRRVVNLGHRFRSSSVFFRRSKQFPRRCADINCMTLPRPVFQGDTIHIQRRTRSGHYFLVPNEETLQLVRYAFAVAAARYGLILHAVCVM